MSTYYSMLKKDYIDFKEACKSSYFKLQITLVLLVVIGLVTGGLAGMFYTRYTDLFAVLFTLGICMSGLIIMWSILLCIGACS
jgi:hypothetical protein